MSTTTVNNQSVVNTQIDPIAKNKYQNFSVTKNYYNHITSTDCNLASIAAKVSVFVAPIILLVTLFADLVLAISNSLCGKEVTDLDLVTRASNIPLPTSDEDEAVDLSKTDEVKVEENPVKLTRRQRSGRNANKLSKTTSTTAQNIIKNK